MHMYFSWSVVGTDNSQEPLAYDVAGPDGGGGPGLAQQAAGEVLKSTEHALIARVEELWPDGQTWFGRRDRHGGIYWYLFQPER